MPYFRNKAFVEASIKSLGLWLYLFGLLFCLPSRGQAWLFYEHANIGVEAYRRLPLPVRTQLDAMWKLLYSSAPGTFCPKTVDPGGSPNTTDAACVDFAALFAMAGDHSCSPDELLSLAANKKVISSILVIAHDTDVKYRKAGKDEVKRKLVGIDADVQLLEADKGYATRAAGNNAHFPISRKAASENETLPMYLTRALDPKAEPNSIAMYTYFHSQALVAARAFKANASVDLARKVISYEAFAVHYLEDLFSSGHYAGTWGDVAIRKGTHDYYSLHGLMTVRWDGGVHEGYGDGNMTSLDRVLTSDAVEVSVEQVMGAALSEAPVPSETMMPVAFSMTDNVCAPKFKTIETSEGDRNAVVEVLSKTPMPTPAPPAITPPRFRQEIGPFIGVVAGARAGVATGGFPADFGSGPRYLDSFELGARLGLGLEGVLGAQDDGLSFLQGGMVMESTQKVSDCEGANCPTGDLSYVPKILGRRGLRFVLRMPFYVLPADLILLAPALYFIDPTAMLSVVRTAVGGGLIPWQRPFYTPIGRLQFIWGREVGIIFWGHLGKAYYVDSQPNQPAALIQFKSLELDMPLLEYQPFHDNASQLTFDMRVQLGYSIEFPLNAQLLPAETPFEGLTTTNFLYLRLTLDARQYI